MIRHCVMLRLGADADLEHLERVIRRLDAVAERLNGAGGLVAGPNRDFENKTGAYPFDFTIDFDSAEDLATYAADPEHTELGSMLVAMCNGGAGGIAVYDIEMDIPG